VGTGSLAILCSIGYMIYMSLIMAIYQEVPSDEVRASQCWAPSPCWGPNPSWKSQCKFEKIAISAKHNKTYLIVAKSASVQAAVRSSS